MAPFGYGVYQRSEEVYPQELRWPWEKAFQEGRVLQPLPVRNVRR